MTTSTTSTTLAARDSVFALILGGGASESLSVLTEIRAEPAVPFGGKFRLIDFPLSNCVNSGIYNVAILTQYRPRSLNNHLGIGKPWDLDRASGGLRLLQPYRGGPYGDWQKGNADAVRRNLDFVANQPEEHVLILAGNHIYLMDYRPMLREHVRKDADVTVAVHRVNQHESYRFGIVSVGSEDRIEEFEEKPKRSRQTLASMGIYIFQKEALFNALKKAAHTDFGRDVIPDMINGKADVHAYNFPGYWANVGTVQSYWEANMSLLAESPALDLYNPDWIVHTRSEERGPVKIGATAKTGGNLLSNGCQINGTVERSVISPGVLVAEDAVVRDSIILNDTLIEAGAIIDRCIVDRNCRIGGNTKLGHGDENRPNQGMPQQLNTGLTLVGCQSTIPANVTVGRNVVIHPDSDVKLFGKKKKIKSGEEIGVDVR